MSSSRAQPKERKERLMRICKIVALVFALVVFNWAVWSSLAVRSKATKGPIEVSVSALQHITDSHTVGGSMNAGKSTFNAGESIPALIKKAELISPVHQSRGNLQRVCNAGRMIGTDRATGRQTSTYTVITTDSGKLVTAFPGLP